MPRPTGSAETLEARQRLGLYFRLHENDISHDEAYDFLW